ncbi:dickkopf-related protein 4-like isoform X1 [Acipenser ruthenus]|uniref:dickkopf-related protein 4-like isoform X1 n=1 Tax=Acipenser ruthenus TaxID=7906 RepID=UPI0027427345|nr:dickkopf-related protein 4-like isoform X1 [Acipenser ruthenus]
MGLGGVLLLSVLCSCVHSLVLDYNTIRGSAEVDLRTETQLDRCMTDSDCESTKFCQNTRAGESVCAACRPLRRRCPRNATCCPGTLCINDVCAQPDEGGVTTGLVSPVTRGKSGHHIQESKPKKQPNIKGLEGESCLRTSDCAVGLCCARHFWEKICKPMPQEGEVCSKRGRKETPMGRELFQRCDCTAGLTCRPQNKGEESRKSRLRVCQRPLEGPAGQGNSGAKRPNRKRRH